MSVRCVHCRQRLTDEEVIEDGDGCRACDARHLSNHVLSQPSQRAGGSRVIGKVVFVLITFASVAAYVLLMLHLTGGKHG